VVAGAVKDDGGVSAVGHGFADFSEVEVEGVGVGVRQDQGGTGAALGTGGAEDVGPVIAPVAGCTRSRALLRPNPGQRALLADASFVLEPDFEWLAVCTGR
jgi:hypothetical protein